MPLELIIMSPAVCSSSAPSGFTAGACLDSKHILVLLASAVLMVLLIRISFYTESVYYCCDPFINTPNADISSTKSRFFLVLMQHIPAALMILDSSGKNRLSVLWVAILLNTIILVERLNKLPGYDKTYTRFTIACIWMRLLSYLASVVSVMLDTNFVEHTLLIISGVILCTYASSRYLDVRESRLFSMPIKNLKDSTKFKAVLVVMINKIRSPRDHEEDFELQGFLRLNYEHLRSITPSIEALTGNLHS